MSSRSLPQVQRIGHSHRAIRRRAPLGRLRAALARTWTGAWLLPLGLAAVFVVTPAIAAPASEGLSGGAAVAPAQEGAGGFGGEADPAGSRSPRNGSPGAGNGTSASAAAASATGPSPAASGSSAPSATSAPGAAASGASASAASPPIAGPDCTRPLSLGLHEHGLLYSSQTGEGIDKDIADELMRRSGCRIKLLVMPRARIWQLLESGTLDFSLSAIADETRERFAAFAWYMSNKYYLLARRDANVRDVEAFRRHAALRIGVIRSFRYGPRANRFVDELDDEQRVTYATGFDPLFQILIENQIQGVIIEPVDYPAIESSPLRALTSILEFDDPPVLHGLVMSRKSLAPEQQQAWRQVMISMRADGTVRRIFEKYFPADLARAMTQF
jgi:polar amino acid transport system substrate-binding protein